MTMHRRDVLAGAAATAALGIGPGSARAADWPTRTVTVIVPYTPGGSTDITARIVGERLSAVLGQRLVVDNKPGAGGNLGMELTARAAPDGYTLGINTTAHAINMTLFKTIGYDALASFEPVALLTENPLVVVVPPGSPFGTVKDLIARAKERPGALNVATSGLGQSTHLAGELFASMAGIKLTFVPYRGSAPAIADVAAGHVDLMFDTTQSVLSQIDAGRLRALAITSAERLPIAKDIPTVAEAALPGYVAIAWNGLVAPKGTPADIVSRLNAETVKALAEAEIAAKFTALGAVSRPLGPAAFRAFIGDEVAKWGDVVRRSGARID